MTNCFVRTQISEARNSEVGSRRIKSNTKYKIRSILIWAATVTSNVITSNHSQTVQTCHSLLTFLRDRRVRMGLQGPDRN